MRISVRRLCALVLALSLTVCLLGPLSPAADAAEMKTAIGTVLASSLRLREGPSTSSAILANASRGDKVIVIRQEGDWYRVVCNLKTGYMHKDYLELDEVKNVKIGYARFDSATNVRRKPTTDSSVIATAPGGDTCFIVGFNRGWYKVSFNGQKGYVRSDLLTLLELPYSNAASKGNTYKESSGSKSSGESKSKDSSNDSPKEPAGSSSSDGSNTGSTLGERVAAYAKQFKGYRYVYGGASPSGFDCSGMVYYIYRQFGYNVGRTSTDQLRNGYTHVSRSNLKPGDIVLFERTYTSSRPATHSGIYIGNGQFIHAANSRLGVIVTSIDNDYYASRFLCGVRIG